MLSKKIVRFLKSGFLVISIGFSMGISGCKGNTEEPVSSEPIEIVSEKGMDDNFINIPIDIYAEATTKNKLKDMETLLIRQCRLRLRCRRWRYWQTVRSNCLISAGWICGRRLN